MPANTEKTTAGGCAVSSHNLLIFGFDIVGVIGSSPTNPTNTPRLEKSSVRGFSFVKKRRVVATFG